MRLLKLALISLVVLCILALAMSALLPSKILVSRAINIAATDTAVKQRLEDIQQWTGWMEGMNDRSVHIYHAHEAQLGNNKVIISTITDSTIISRWESRNGSSQLSTFRILYQPLQKLTIVQWQFEQQIKWYPWEKLGSLMNDKILGTMMERNLGHLRQTIEAQTSKL